MTTRAPAVLKTQKMSENGEIYTAGKNFTLTAALTAWINSTSDRDICALLQSVSFNGVLSVKCFEECYGSHIASRLG